MSDNALVPITPLHQLSVWTRDEAIYDQYLRPILGFRLEQAIEDEQLSDLFVAAQEKIELLYQGRPRDVVDQWERDDFWLSFD